MSAIDISRLIEPVPFSSNKPELWFQQIEAQFWTYTITEDFMKYNYVITQLDRESLIQVEDIMLSPPDFNRYETLKCVLIDRLAKLKIKNLKNILNDEECGTDKPSDYLKRLKDLAGDQLEELSIKEAWVNGLSCKMLWVISSELFSSPLERLAQIADAAHSMLPAVRSPDSLKPSDDQEKPDPKMEQFVKEVCDSITLNGNIKSGQIKTRRSRNHKQLPAGKFQGQYSKSSKHKTSSQSD